MHKKTQNELLGSPVYTNILRKRIISPGATHLRLQLTIRTDTENRSIYWRRHIKEANRHKSNHYSAHHDTHQDPGAVQQQGESKDKHIHMYVVYKINSVDIIMLCLGWGCLKIGCWREYLGLRGECGKLHNELNGLYCSPNIVCVIKLRRMRWAGHVACMGERRGV